jgi:hypothetical protein
VGHTGAQRVPLTLRACSTDQATPRASDQKNPFDFMRPGTPGSRKSSFSVQPPTPSSGSSFKIPFFGGHQPPSQQQPALAELSTSLPSSDGASTPGSIHTAAQMAAATTSLTKKEPDFTLQSSSLIAKRKDDAAKQHSPSTSVSSQTSPIAQRGTLSLKLIQARNLAVHSSAARPYIVATYDQNEFVGREPIADDAPPMVSYVGRSGAQTPMQRNSPPSQSNFGSLGSSGAQSALAKSLEAHRQSQLYHQRQKSGDASRTGPAVQAGPSKNAVPPKKGEPSAYDPVWKQEVILCVPSLGVIYR